MEIKGEKVSLIPIEWRERDEFYELAMKSYGSRFWYDEKRKKERTKIEFFRDWHKGYFDLKHPDEGQCFWIVVGANRIGQINYNKIDRRNKKTEIDIIIGPKKYISKGYGTDALKSLIKYLFGKFDLNKVWVEPRVTNIRAIKAYEKAGFKKEGLLRQEDYFRGKFVDCVRMGILRKDFKKKY